MNKKFLLGGLMAFLLVGLVTAAVVYSTITVDITVDEALTTTTFVLPVPEQIYMGSFTSDIIVENGAGIDLNTEIKWFESLNDDGVIYTTDMPKTLILVPGSNTVTVEFTIANDSPIGNFQGNIMLERVA